MQRDREEDQQEQESKDSPSFRLIQMDSPERISAVHDSHRTDPHDDEDDDDDDDDDDFEFSFIRIPEARPPIAADGNIRPVYPIFNRNLLLNLDDEPQKEEEAERKEESKLIRLPLRRLFIEEEREQASFSSTSSSASASASASSLTLDEFDGIAPGTYCVWTPPSKNHRCKKSSSTGSSSPSRRWRLKDLVLGRSQSDGKEKFVFIPIQGEEDGGLKKKLEKNNSSDQGKKSSTEVDGVTAQRRMTPTQYGQRNGQEVGRGGGRKSFLPYRQDLVGFLASVNGLSRSHNPS